MRIRQVFATFGWWQWLLAAVLLVAVVVAGMFGVRTVRFALHWGQGGAEPIEGWMPVNYVAHAYNVPSEVLWTALGESGRGTLGRPDHRPLSKIAAARGQTLEQVRTTLLEAIARAQPQQPPPSPPPSSGGTRGGP